MLVSYCVGIKVDIYCHFMLKMLENKMSKINIFPTKLGRQLGSLKEFRYLSDNIKYYAT